MFSIGEFASIGRVSIRMLRHYDEIGLLAPARVDPFTGYRFYDGSQFEVLARILALKDLGLTLDEVTRIVAGLVSDDALHALLADRRRALAVQLDLDRARLDRLDAKIRQIEGVPLMSTLSTELKPLPAVVVAQASAPIPGFGPENVSPVIGPLFDTLYANLVAARITPGNHALAMYEADAENDTGARAYAAFPVAEATASASGYTVTEIAGVELAATTVHRGSMSTIGESWEALSDWVVENGYHLSGPCRELYLVSQPEPQENWVTELQQPVVRA
ncbi:MerR family transcriptional regulator [Mycetocola zhadangensis]|uniref:MerR family transcriptional regulator n=1 Tax=Mycetocola zhadangensis TaxID=1164595 RepID=UPI003A4E0C84